MSAEDNFEIVLEGMGSHAACPHWGREVLVAACALVMDLQTIVSRRLSPTDVGVVSVTELLTDGTRNVLPGLARKQTNRQHYKSLREYLDHHNAHLTPFVWTKSATNILEKVARGRRALKYNTRPRTAINPVARAINGRRTSRASLRAECFFVAPMRPALRIVIGVSNVQAFDVQGQDRTAKGLR